MREAGCPYCREWDAKIGPIYGKTAEARRAPIREIDKRDVPASGLTLARPVRYTPTFLLTRDDIELGRIEGYPGEDFFWARLDRLLELLPPE
ncbi:SoxS protein [Rhodoplanes roseus]|uniref:SoxS protein n=1 Tax=Rhodoplanes roseus TaxID=29409 RepID=A0A327KWM1_9BRAD|nr:SoxS protein [Rhodoplanes roseus]